MVLSCSICSLVFVVIVVIWFCFWVGPRLSPGFRVLSILLESDSCGWPQQVANLVHELCQNPCQIHMDLHGINRTPTNIQYMSIHWYTSSHFSWVLWITGAHCRSFLPKNRSWISRPTEAKWFATDLSIDVSENRGTPKSSILVGFFSIINHPFVGYPKFWFNTHILRDSMRDQTWFLGRSLKYNPWE